MLPHPDTAPPTLPSTVDQDERRRARLRADLALALAWLRVTVGPERWSGLSLRMGLRPGPSVASIATRITEALVDLDGDTQRTLLGMLDEMIDDLVMSRPHRRLFAAESAALEELRDRLARV